MTHTEDWQDVELALAGLIPPKPPKEYVVEQDELEVCPFCGYLLEDPCETPPPDYCDKALAANIAASYLKKL